MKIEDLFDIRYGQKEYHNKENLDYGECLLISSQAVDNGCYGFFDVKPKFRPPFITVPSTGSIGFAFVQLFPCCVCDDALVLTPKVSMTEEYLFYVAVVIQKMRWRFNYGRKITPSRLGRLPIHSPEEIKIDVSFSTIFNMIYPQRASTEKLKTKKPKMKDFLITELFDLERGQFHAINRLEEGEYPTVSRVSTENGVVGFHKKPKNAKIYPPCMLTVSTVTGDTFLQINEFIATDNVLVCVPKKDYKIHALFYIQVALNGLKWRYSYGRQPYKRIFQKTVIKLPVKEDGTIDEEYIRKVVTTQPYFQALLKRIRNINPTVNIYT